MIFSITIIDLTSIALLLNLDLFLWVKQDNYDFQQILLTGMQNFSITQPLLTSSHYYLMSSLFWGYIVSYNKHIELSYFIRTLQLFLLHALYTVQILVTPIVLYISTLVSTLIKLQ